MRTARIWRLALVALAIMNAASVNALVAAHVGECDAAQSVIETRDLAARIEVAAHAVADLARR
jgi:hypothetical protein